jgi:MFS family permease
MTNAAPAVAAPPHVEGEFRAHWKIVVTAALGVGAGVTGTTIYSLGIFINPLSDAFGWSRTEVSAAKTFITFGFVLTAPFIGYLADRFGVRRIGMISMVGLAFAMMGMTQIDGSITMFYAALFLLALAGCGTTPLVWTRGVASWFEQRRGLALGLTLTGSGLAGVITPPALGYLIDTYGWQAGYIGMAAAALLVLIPIGLFFFENGRQAGPAQVRSTVALKSGLDLVATLRTLRFWQIGVGFMLVGGAISSMTVHLVPLLTDAGMARDIAVRIAGILGVAVILGRVTTGYLVDRFHPPYIAAAFLLMPIIACALLASGPLSLGLVLTAAACIGLAAGSEVDLVPYLTARYFGLKAYGKIYGSVFVCFYAGVGVGPLFLGWMYDRNGDYAIALLIVIPVLALGALSIGALGKPPIYHEPT